MQDLFSGGPSSERPATQGMALSSGRCWSGARGAGRSEQEPDAPSRQGLGAQLPRFGGAPAGAGGRGRADGAGGGRPFGVRSTFLRAYVADGREEGTTSAR